MLDSSRNTLPTTRSSSTPVTRRSARRTGSPHCSRSRRRGPEAGIPWRRKTPTRRRTGREPASSGTPRTCSPSRPRAAAALGRGERRAARSHPRHAERRRAHGGRAYPVEGGERSSSNEAAPGVAGDDGVRDDAVGGVPEHRRARRPRRVGHGPDLSVQKAARAAGSSRIAVCDAGVGFRQSLESGQRRPLTDRWDDGRGARDRGGQRRRAGSATRAAARA